MANSANPEINKKIATSALGTLVIATVFFYLGDRYAETLVTYPGQIFDHLSDAFLSMWQTIKDAPFALDMTSNSLLFGGACFLIIWMIWLRYVAFIGNYRSGEESGSARWGTVKEGKKFKDLQTEDNNLLFTKNFGLALHRPKFDPEYDRNLNVLVVGGSGSGKTFNYVTPNICQLNTSYFVTDPKGTLLKDAGYLFTDNGYKLKSFNTINLDESMHYNPLKYVKTDTDILSFVNCFIMNTNPEGKSSGDPFWENAEKMLYTALIALLRDWFPAKDYNMSSLLTLLSLAEARENDENFKSALDLMFLQIEEGKKYKQNDGSSQGRDLIDAAEIGKMSRLKAILLIAGTNPLMDDKYDPHAHKRYRYIVDKRNWKRLHKNAFDFERYLKNGCEPYTPDEDTGAEFTAWKWAAWKKSRKGLLGILLNR